VKVENHQIDWNLQATCERKKEKRPLLEKEMDKKHRVLSGSSKEKKKKGLDD